MPKIDKKTLKILPRTNIRIYKFENRHTYFCSFYIGLGHTNKKSGKFEKTLQTKNVNEAIKKATELYKEWFRTHTDTKRVKAKDFDIDIASPYLQFKIRKYKNKTHLKNNEQGERDKAKWNNYLKPFFEDVDYTTRDWRTRNKIKTNDGSKWLTIPVKKKPRGTKIFEIEIINDGKWQKKHKSTIAQCYAKAPYYNDFKWILDEIYDREWISLSDFNIYVTIYNHF